MSDDLLNCYEETNIQNTKLPISWRSQSELDELSQFLQTNWEHRSVFYDDGEIASRQQFLTFTGQKGIRTGRYIGTIAFKGQHLNIFPKMFKPDKDNHDTQDLSMAHLMKNLVQWIDYCNRFDYPHIYVKSNFEDSSDLKDLFVTLYIHYVKSAIERGLFYQYEDRQTSYGSIKGKFDLREYVCNKIPFGKANSLPCTFSSFEVDNRLNRIIKYTCKLLSSNAKKPNQRLLRFIHTKLGEVSDVNCVPSDCDAVLLSRLHRNYRVVLSMSKMFLLNQLSTFDMDNNESFCFLFPTHYLFEGFIGGFMQSALAHMAKVRLHASEVALVEDIIIEERSFGKAFTMRHDILVEHKDKGLYIFDTKYKEISRIKGNPDAYSALMSEAKQPDIYQVFTYAIKRDIKDVYLLYPMYRLEDENDAIPTMFIPFTVDGLSYSLKVHIVRLPFVFDGDADLLKLRLAAIVQSFFE